MCSFSRELFQKAATLNLILSEEPTKPKNMKIRFIFEHIGCFVIASSKFDNKAVHFPNSTI